MSMTTAIPGNTASTFLAHCPGSGLADGTFGMDRFRTMVASDICCGADEPPAAKRGRRKAWTVRRHRDGAVIRRTIGMWCGC